MTIQRIFKKNKILKIKKLNYLYKVYFNEYKYI